MNKDTSFLINRKFNKIKKDRWFYDRFEYCIGFHLDEVSCLRVLDHAHIDDFIERRKQWQEIAQQRWIKGGQKYGLIMRRRWNQITPQTVIDLHTLTDILLSTQGEFKLVVSLNQGYVYTNDLSLIDRLDAMPELTFKTYTRAQISRPKNTIQLKKSPYKLRTFFKLIKLTPEQKYQLEGFLLSQQANVRLSPALQTWIDQPFTRIQDYFFIDHETESWLTLISLVVPGIVRKTMHIISTK